MKINVIRETKIDKTLRVQQLGSMFDAPVEDKSRMIWTGDFPFDAEPWSVGLIVGPSGAGKSTIAREAFGKNVDVKLKWTAGSVIDDFDKKYSIQEIAKVCSAVGFNTIPSWMRPFSVLSTGEKFRVELARRLMECADPVMVDEFTSVVDRQVAQIGSHAVQKYIRRNNRKFVAVSCHYDIIEWLQPDWVLEPAHNPVKFIRRRLRQRPKIDLRITRVSRDLWPIFAPYHYMSADLNHSAQCFGLFAGETLTGFCGIFRNPGRSSARPVYRVSRIVILPDWQGLGLAFVMLDALGGWFKAIGKTLHNYPAHPGFIRAHDRSRKWSLRKNPGMYVDAEKNARGVGRARPCAVFRYSGPAGDVETARKMIETKVQF